MNIDGKYNSTAIKLESEKEIKKEVKWELKKTDSFVSQKRDDRYLSAEYSSGYNFNDSISAMNESQLTTDSDAFPMPLNPLFDLSALVMVRAHLSY